MIDDPITATISKPYLPDVINYETDIAPHPLIKLYAGVGSGKNTFAGHLMNGAPELGIPKKTVLLVTSRKAKVVETLSDPALDVARPISDERSELVIFHTAPYDFTPYRRTLDNGQQITQCSVACTGAYIQWYLEHRHIPGDPSTHLWNRFDIIIVDEAHSLVTDATYQTAPFHVTSLIKETLKKILLARDNDALPPEQQDPCIQHPVCQNLILMTGTPDALNKLDFLSNARVLDKRSTCRSVEPQNIYFLDQSQAQRQIRYQLQDGQRIIYFANHITPAEDLASQYGLPEEKTVMCFSDETRLKALKTASDKWKKQNHHSQQESPYERLMDVQFHLAQTSFIRPDIQFLATTSKNKEGININDRDIKHVYIESHQMTDIHQMSGRLRCGAENVYIITDAPGHYTPPDPYAKAFASFLCTPVKSSSTDHSPLNCFLSQQCLEKGLENPISSASSLLPVYHDDHTELGDIIDYLRGNNPHYEFDFLSRQFQVNSNLSIGRSFMYQELAEYQQAANNPESLAAYFQKNFSASTIHLHKTKEEEAKELLEDILARNPSNHFTLAQIIDIATRVNAFFSKKHVGYITGPSTRSAITPIVSHTSRNLTAITATTSCPNLQKRKK